MKLKKIFSAAFVIMAVSLVMTGCPMTAKDYQKEKNIEYQLMYDEGLMYSIRWKTVQSSIVPSLFAGSDVSKSYIDKKVKEFNEDNAKNDLSAVQKHYGVQKKKVVYNGSDLKGKDYKGKNHDDITNEIMKLFSIQ